MNPSWHTISTNDIKALALALRAGRLDQSLSEVTLRRVVTHSSLESVIAAIRSFKEQGWTSSQIALFLEEIATDRSVRQTIDNVMDIVTTGPEIAGVDNRDTSVIVRDLFTRATTSVLVAGYAIYQGQKVFQTLANRMKESPELSVRIILDIQRGQGDTSTDIGICNRFAERFRKHQWPSNSPLPDIYYDPRSLSPNRESRACMHAKCIIIDQCQVFVSSANFTEAAHLRNIEVGLVIESTNLARRLTDFFSRMIDHKSLSKLNLNYR